MLIALCYLTILREILWLRPLFIYVLGMGVASAEKESDYGFSPWGLYLTSDPYQEAVLLLIDPNLVSLGRGCREYISGFSSFGSCVCDTDVYMLKGKSV